MRPLFACLNLRLLACAVLIALTSACRQTPPAPDSTVLLQREAQGYLTATRVPIRHVAVTMNEADGGLALHWTLPATLHAETPVLIYLPGLGQSAGSGVLWREAWARAGYAVVAVQLLPEDGERLPVDPKDRDLAVSFAHSRFSPSVGRQRVRALAALVAHLRDGAGQMQSGEPRSDIAGANASMRNPLAGQMPWLASLDWQHLGILGFDLGAQTALLAAGDRPFKDWTETGLHPAVVVLLSPHADFSGQSFQVRYQTVQAPVLSISGDLDLDPWRVVTSATVRQAPFRNLAPGRAALLWLTDLMHGQLAGGEEATDGRRGSADAADDAGNPASATRPIGDTSPAGPGAPGGPGGRSSGRGGAGGPGGSGSRGGAETNGRNGQGGLRALDPRNGGGASVLGATERATDTLLVRVVTTAFLDAVMRHDDTAQAWLNRQAAAWVGLQGRFQQR